MSKRLWTYSYKLFRKGLWYCSFRRIITSPTQRDSHRCKCSPLRKRDKAKAKIASPPPIGFKSDPPGPKIQAGVSDENSTSPAETINQPPTKPSNQESQPAGQPQTNRLFEVFLHLEINDSSRAEQECCFSLAVRESAALSIIELLVQPMPRLIPV